MTPSDRNNGTIHRLLLPKAVLPPSTPPLLKLAITYWRSAIRYTNAKMPYAPTVPLLGIPLPTGRLTARKLQTWTEAGITQVSDFFADGVLMPHNIFIQTHNIAPSTFLLHAQTSHYIRETWAQDDTEPPTNTLLTMQYLMGDGAHLVRWLTNGIRTERLDTLQPLRGKWERDIEHTFTDKQWERILEFPKKTSRNPKFKLIQLMILHRAYLTPRRLHLMFPESENVCPRCHTPDAGFIHMLWDCPRLGHYWSVVHAVLQTTTLTTHNNTLEYYLLGLPPKKAKNTPVTRFLNLALLLAKRNITMRWKSKSAPSLLNWQTETLKWGKAEGLELKREECRGIRKTPISLDWNTIIIAFEAVDIQLH